MATKHRTARTGQSTLELVWLVVAIVAIITAMQTILRRAVGGRYRSSIDQLSQQQFDPTTDFNYSVRSSGTRTDTTSTTGVSTSMVGDDTATPGNETTTQSVNIGSATEVVVNKTGALN